MSKTIAGNFESKTVADTAVRELRATGIAEDHICTFRINPPGQHGKYPIGGDDYASPGAEDAGGGALSGAAIGGAIGLGAGLAALPIAGPAAMIGGAGIGAYVGSLAGALKNMGQDEEDGKGPPGGEEAHPAGVLVAVQIADEADPAPIIDILRQTGAREVEETEGTWRNGTWIDFDPTAHKIAASTQSSPRT
jgi:hypothetical protein